MSKKEIKFEDDELKKLSYDLWRDMCLDENKAKIKKLETEAKNNTDYVRGLLSENEKNAKVYRNYIFGGFIINTALQLIIIYAFLCIINFIQ